MYILNTREDEKGMTIRIDKETAEAARILAHENDTRSLQLSDRLPESDFRTLQEAAKVWYRIARKGVVEVKL